MSEASTPSYRRLGAAEFRPVKRFYGIDENFERLDRGGYITFATNQFVDPTTSAGAAATRTLQDRVGRGMSVEFVAESLDAFAEPNPTKAHDRRAYLTGVLMERSAQLVALLKESDGEFYFGALQGGEGQRLDHGDEVLYAQDRWVENARYTIAPRLKSFAVTDHKRQTPLHIEPVVEAGMRDSGRIGFLPLGAIPLTAPIFRSVEGKRQ